MKALKNRTEYNIAYDYMCWLMIKPEYGGPKTFDRDEFEKVKGLVKEYDHRMRSKRAHERP